MQCGTDGQRGYAGYIEIKYCMLQKKDVNGRTMPQQVTVYGKPYELSGQEEMEYLTGMESGEGEVTGSVTVEVNSSTLPDSPAAKAEIAGSQGNYILRISDNSDAGKEISGAYRRASGKQLKSLQVYDITLQDAVNKIPITKLGRQRMTITIPNREEYCWRTFK